MPHIHCYLYQPLLVGVMLLTDLLIGLAYLGISLILWALFRRLDVSYSLVILFFGLFIAACGGTHLMEVWTLWYSDYWIAAAVKSVAAIASVGTGIYLFRLRHPILNLAAAAKTAAQRGVRLEKQALDLTEMNRSLKKNEEMLRLLIMEKKRTADELRLANENLERKVEERTVAYRESEARFRSLTHAISQLVWIAHPDGSIYWYNQQWFDYTGTTPEEMKGWGWQSVHDPHELSRVLAAWRIALETQEPFEQTFPLRSADGQYRWFLTRVIPIKDENGKVIHWIGTNTDVHDLREAREAAESATRLKSRFLDIAAHELRTPVTAFAVLLQFSQKQLEKGHPISLSTLMKLRAQVERLSRLVVDLLDVSRLERGVLKLNLELTDLASLISDCFDAFKLQSPTRLFVFLKPEQPVEVSIDSLRIYQVISNLIDNAMRYSPENTPIEITLEATASRVTVSVKDQGVGLSSDQLNTLFLPFVRGTSDREEQTSGLGLGLFICKSIIDLHGGVIRVISTPGDGSIFTFDLPRKP